MITVDKYLMGRTRLGDLSSEMQDDVNLTVNRANELMRRFGKSRELTSGIRTMSDQIRIYKDKAAKKQYPFLDGVYDEAKVPKKSKHISCQAIDLEDADGEFKKWLKTAEGLKAMEEIGLWQEDPATTPTWVHVQTVPPGSGSRVFHP